MRRLGLLTCLAVGAVALTACSAPGEPEVTFFADGHAVNTAPLAHCDAITGACTQSATATANLKVRPGKPVQVSVPGEVAKTPWLVNVQYANAKGELQPVIQRQFLTGDRFAYTATPPAPDDQLLVVEIQQAAPAVQDGKLIVDAEGIPQLIVRAIWSLQIQPASPARAH